MEWHAGKLPTEGENSCLSCASRVVNTNLRLADRRLISSRLDSTCLLSNEQKNSHYAMTRKLIREVTSRSSDMAFSCFTGLGCSKLG